LDGVFDGAADGTECVTEPVPTDDRFKFRIVSSMISDFACSRFNIVIAPIQIMYLTKILERAVLSGEKCHRAAMGSPLRAAGGDLSINNPSRTGLPWHQPDQHWHRPVQCAQRHRPCRGGPMQPPSLMKP